MANPGALHEWIVALPERGRYDFTRREVETMTSGSSASIKMTLYRLKKSGAIVSPRRDFFVVVPREYRSAGSPPASWYIDHLMRHRGRKYYVSLLSAAALHGAGHQQPIAFQVITDVVERNIKVGRVRIEFHTSSMVETAATQRIQTETGSMRISTPETTAFDLVRFPFACGNWNNVVTVLADLAEALDVRKLVAEVPRVARSDIQRLGWLLELIDEHVFANALAQALEGQRLAPIPLTNKRENTDARLDPRWRVLINDVVEPDL